MLDRSGVITVIATAAAFLLLGAILAGVVHAKGVSISRSVSSAARSMPRAAAVTPVKPTTLKTPVTGPAPSNWWIWYWLGTQNRSASAAKCKKDDKECKR